MKTPSTYRLTQHTVSKRWRVEQNYGDGTGWYVEDERTFLFKWYAKIVMYNMIAAEIERVTYKNGTWEERE